MFRKEASDSPLNGSSNYSTNCMKKNCAKKRKTNEKIAGTFISLLFMSLGKKIALNKMTPAFTLLDFSIATNPFLKEDVLMDKFAKKTDEKNRKGRMKNPWEKFLALGNEPPV